MVGESTARERLSRLARARVNGVKRKRGRDREREIPLEIYICIEKMSEKKVTAGLRMLMIYTRYSRRNAFESLNIGCTSAIYLNYIISQYYT